MSKATTLAIGTPDGFDVSDNADFTIEKTHTLVCKPAGESLKLSDPNIPATLLPLLNALIEHMSASVSAVSARHALPLFPFISGLAALCACECKRCLLIATQESHAWKPADLMISRYAGTPFPPPPPPHSNLNPLTENLPVVDDPPRISSDPKTWRCAASGMTTNLWLNLSTGYIGGGRKNHDGR